MVRRRKVQVGVTEFERLNALQIHVPAIALGILTGAHLLVPSAKPYTAPFYTISACEEPDWWRRLGLAGDGPFSAGQGYCAKVTDDAYFVALFVLAFTMVRAAMMNHVFVPLARSKGIRTERIVARFAEQAWGLTYALSSWTCGIYLLYRSHYWNNIEAMFVGFDRASERPMMKLYYLVEFSFWLQQIVSLNIESKRKDYYQMFGHHILTCLLMWLSWQKNTVSVGHGILVLMDFSDILLPAAKLLKYARHQTLCDVGFVAFLISWVVTRHYLLSRLIYKIWLHQPLVVDGQNQTNIFVFLLSALELVICVWSAAIAKVLYGVVVGAGAQDNRSDSESADELDPVHDVSVEKVADAVDRVPDDKEHLPTPPPTSQQDDFVGAKKRLVNGKATSNGFAHANDGVAAEHVEAQPNGRVNGTVNGNVNGKVNGHAKRH